MDVAVDAAGQDQEARGVNLARRSFDLLRDARDPSAADADIGSESVRCGRNRAAPDRKIEIGQGSFPPFAERSPAAANRVAQTRIAEQHPPSREPARILAQHPKAFP
jgi:hypothetical protein